MTEMFQSYVFRFKMPVTAAASQIYMKHPISTAPYIFSVDRHSILDNVGRSVRWLVGWSHCEDDLSNHENMHENAVIHDDTSNLDNQDDPANHVDSANHDDSANHVDSANNVD